MPQRRRCWDINIYKADYTRSAVLWNKLNLQFSFLCMYLGRNLVFGAEKYWFDTCNSAAELAARSPNQSSSLINTCSYAWDFRSWVSNSPIDWAPDTIGQIAYACCRNCVLNRFRYKAICTTRADTYKPAPEIEASAPVDQIYFSDSIIEFWSGIANVVCFRKLAINDASVCQHLCYSVVRGAVLEDKPLC